MVGLWWLLHEDVEARPGDLLLGQGAQERVLVHHGTAAGVDEDGLRLHESELSSAHHLARAVREGHVQADHVGGAQELLEEHEARPDAVFLVLGEPHHVVVLNLHVEGGGAARSEEHTSELQSRGHLVCRLLLEKKKQNIYLRRLLEKKK